MHTLPPFHLCSHGSGRSWRLGRSVALVVRSPPPMDPPPSGKRPRSRRRGRRMAPGRSGGNPCQRLLRSSAREPAGLYLALCSVGDWRGMDEASPCFLWNRPWMETRARDLARAHRESSRNADAARVIWRAPRIHEVGRRLSWGVADQAISSPDQLHGRALGGAVPWTNRARRL